MSKWRTALTILSAHEQCLFTPFRPGRSWWSRTRFARPPGHRLVHAALILAWQMARKLPPRQPEGERSAIQWIKLSAPDSDSAPAPHRKVTQAMRAEPRREGRRALEDADRLAPAPLTAARVPTDAPPAEPEPVAAPSSETERPALPRAESILDKARRSAGGIDRALREEGQPTITAPLDSPQIRVRQGMEGSTRDGAAGLGRARERYRRWRAPYPCCRPQQQLLRHGQGARHQHRCDGEVWQAKDHHLPAARTARQAAAMAHRARLNVQCEPPG